MTDQKKATVRIARHCLLAGLGLLALLPGTSSAYTTYSGACGIELTLVSQAIDNGIYYGSNAATNESSLQTKLGAANSKITLRKYGDAIDKLSDLSDTATALANAKKAKLNDAAAINNAVLDAINCAANL